MKQRWASVFGGFMLAVTTLSANAGLSDGLVGYWNFDSCDAKDSSGNGNNGILNGGISCVAGKQSKALSFNGVDAYIQVPYSPSLDASSAVTISAWVNVANGDPAVIVEKGQSGIIWEYGMTVYNGLPGIRITDGDAYISNNGASYNTWQHFTAIITNNSVKTYLNGTPLNGSLSYYAGRAGPYLMQSNYGLQIGLGHPAQWFKGSLDELRIYNRALSAADVQALYNEPNSAPDAPTIGIATAGNASATVNFTAPINTGGSAIIDYTVSCSASGQTTQATTGTSSPITVSNLNNSAIYACSVVARNTAGNSSASGTVSLTPSNSLSGLTVNCPSTVNSGASGACTASAAYSSGTGGAINPSWTSSNTAAAMMNGNTLIAGTVTADTPVTLTASHTENGVTKTATANVTIKAAAATLSGLTLSCPASLNAGASGTCSATAGYTNGTGNAVNATWTSSNSSVASVNGNTVTASGSLTTDTPVSINASYTENGVTKTATAMVSIKAVVVQLTNLMISGGNSVDAGKTAPYNANAVYSDGTTKTQTHVTWSSSGSGATIDSNGILTAQAGLTFDATVTITALYTEGQTTKTAQQTVTIKATAAVPVPVVPATACGGTGGNFSGITIAGNAIKKPGDALDVNYCLKNFNSASKFDIYVAVALPDGNMFFLQTVGFFGTPLFDLYVQDKAPAKYLANTLIPDKSGTVLAISVLPMETPSGTYTFYAIPVLAGKNVFDFRNHVGKLVSEQVTLSK